MNVSNDTLVTLLSVVATYWIIRLARHGFTWPLGFSAAVAMALAFLSKINALFLPLPFAIAVLSEKVPWRIRFGRLSVLLVTFLIATP
jgi:4-amino-4-deoxy-L-arabinose transferase-like glycosyltransferase